jgi:hypothetical protein
MYMNKINHKARDGAKVERILATLERGLGRDGPRVGAGVCDLPGVTGNAVASARCTIFLSMLLRGVVAALLAGGVAEFAAAADFLPAGFLAGGGEGAVLGSFFWRLRMSFPRSSSALL